MIISRLRRATKSRETLLLPLTEAAGEEAKWLTCLQNLIAIMCWIRAWASRSSWRFHDCLLSTQHSDRWSWSLHQYWQKRVASFCFGVPKQIHFQQGFKMAVWCVPSRSRHTSLLLPCCRSKQLGRAVASAGFHSLPWNSYPQWLLRTVLNGKISVAHGDLLKIALGDLLLIATCNASARLSHSVLLQRQKSVLALLMNCLTQCAV